MDVDLLQDGLLRIADQEAAPELAPFPTLQRLDPGRPTPSGPCSLCQERPASERCLHCERLVCKDDLWVMLGLCKACSTPQENRAAREGRRTTRPDLGIKWIEE